MCRHLERKQRLEKSKTYSDVRRKKEIHNFNTDGVFCRWERERSPSSSSLRPTWICDVLGWSLFDVRGLFWGVDDDEIERFKLNVSFWGRTVMIKLWLLATIMSVTWSSVFPLTSIPFTSMISSPTDSSPVDSARPPASKREIKTPGTFSTPLAPYLIATPSRM